MTIISTSIYSIHKIIPIKENATIWCMFAAYYISAITEKNTTAGNFQQSNISLFFSSHFRLFDDTFHLYHCFCRFFLSSMSVMYVFCWCSFKKLFSVEIIVSQGLVSSDKSLQDTIVSLALVLMCAEFIRLSPKWVYEVLSTQWGANAGLFFFSVFFSLFA